MNSFREITTADPLYPQVFKLREDVLRAPLGLSLNDEDLSGDRWDRIFIALSDEGEVLACLMLHDKGEGILKLRQMAVRPERQGHGTGSDLVHFAEQSSASSECRLIELHARATAVSFYKNLGYAQTGDSFIEVGIPHVRMEKMLPGGNF